MSLEDARARWRRSATPVSDRKPVFVNEKRTADVAPVTDPCKSDPAMGDGASATVPAMTTGEAKLTSTETTESSLASPKVALAIASAVAALAVVNGWRLGVAAVAVVLALAARRYLSAGTAV
eukprot:CAMPEP_0174833452 /NCGR_PEP_ID=MMETSP1114-20130205/4248_1 /TAXON_ID=312471 /ORGANISM="Neobodo designis, Strain CCAP 1951/1" /LENGTH=121 /DNA_ID=CAMNT_0016067335 /DNA_START=55 /DNA_END=420 /DNA_ORIENTATION=-